jgi:hypothetical protein
MIFFVVNVQCRALVNELCESSVTKVEDITACHTQDCFEFLLLEKSEIGHRFNGLYIEILSTILRVTRRRLRS